MSDTPMCKYQDEFFIDDVKFQTVGSLGAVVDGAST